MRILVTGGAGYVGSHCLRALLRAGHDAVVLDNLVTGHRAAVDPAAELIVGDVADAALLDRLFSARPFDAVMHFAASLDVGESVREPLKYYRNNVAATLTLLDAMQRHRVARLVFSSTCATFGVPASLPITEDLPQSPINPYGHTKLTIEWMLRDSAAAWGLGSAALRYFNAAGAADDATIGEHHDPETHLIPIILQVALGRRDRVSIFGTDYPTPDGSCIRDYIHVDDLASAHLLALDALRPATPLAYNVGTGRGTSVLEVIAAARRITGHPIPAAPAPRRPGDPPSLYAGPDRIQRELGWSPCHTDIAAIIDSAWRWHSTHPHGYT